MVGNIQNLRHTKTDRVYYRLRQMIIDLEMQPGEFIRKEDLTHKFDVSRAPVNEGLARLQAEDLVFIAPQHGTFVQHICLAKLQEGIFFRRAIEPKAMAIVSQVISDETLDCLEANLELQRNAVKADDLSSLHRIDDAFHALLLESESFQHSRRVIKTFSAHLERARNLAALTKRKSIDTLEDHERIVAALRARDAGWAESAMEMHLASAFMELTRAMRDTPDVFETESMSEKVVPRGS